MRASEAPALCSVHPTVPTEGNKPETGVSDLGAGTNGDRGVGQT